MYELTFADIASKLIQNAFDQAREGLATRIEVELRPAAIRVRDDGPGLPVHPHPFSKRPLLEVILQGPRRGPQNSLARATACCLWLEVEVLREGRRYRQRYEFARPTASLEDLGQAPGSGTAFVCAPAEGAPPTFPQLVDHVRELGRDVEPRVEVEVTDARSGESERLVFGGE
jgi:DNA gyrase/topoisomerase IV subunit B